MNFYTINDDLICLNNSRILSKYQVQNRYATEQKKQNTHETCIDNNLKRFLMAIYNTQYNMTLTETIKLAKLPAGTGSRIADQCTKKNLIKLIQLPFGRGRPKYPVLLYESFKILGIKANIQNGKGAGYEHTLYQHLIAKHFSDFKPKIELNRNGKFIDVAIETNESLIAIEVAMTSTHEKENIEKDINNAHADYVIIACINKKVEKEIQDILPQINIKFQLNMEIWMISKLLKTKPEEILNNQIRLI